MRIPASISAITDINAKYHDFLAPTIDTYQEQYHPKVLALYKDIFDRIFSFFKSKNKEKLSILDVGCGTGYLEQFLQPEINEIVGIDVSQKLLAKAKNKYPRVKYYLADIYKFKSRKKYDLIVENSVLHHLKDYEMVLAKMIYMLKFGGCLFLGDEPNYYAYRYLPFIKYLFRYHLQDKRKLKTADIRNKFEKHAEYHLFFSGGINPFKLKQYLSKRGLSNVYITFSSREFFASLIDRLGLYLVNYLPNFVLDSTGILSRMFYLTAFK